ALERAFGDETVLRIEDAAASPLIPTEVAAELGMGALLLAPIRGVDRAPIGVLLFDFRLDCAPGQPSPQPAPPPSPLTPERQRLAGAVAGQLALLLENALLYEQLRRRTSRPAALAGRFDALSSAICLPLRLRRRTFGALAVVSPRAHAFTTEQVEFLTTVAAQAAVTLEHGRLYTLLRTKGEVRGRLLDQTLQAQENERKHLVE